MSAGWAAAAVRGQGLLRRRLGPEGARRLAQAPSLNSALRTLGSTPYRREIRQDLDLEGAQHAVSATVLWHLRILAGWCPPLGAEPLRLLAGGFEVANITGHLVELSGHPARPPYSLGSLASAWGSVANAQNAASVRAELRTSVWGDPDSDQLPAIRLALQLAWARRLMQGAPGGADWAVAGAALLIARLLIVGAGLSLGPTAIRDTTRLLGPTWQRASSVEELAESLPPVAASALQGVTDVASLWRGEARWWATVETSAAKLVARPRPDPSVAVGVGALLSVDAWRVRGALVLAARGGGTLEEVHGGAA